MRLMFGIERWSGLSALVIPCARQPGALPQAGMATGLWPSTQEDQINPRHESPFHLGSIGIVFWILSGEPSLANVRTAITLTT